MTEHVNLTVLSVPIAAIDRRALSQAWYSALRLAGRKHSAGEAGVRPHGDAAHTLRHTKCERITPPMAERSARAQTARTVTARGADAAAAAGDRRAVRSELARRIERAFFEARSPVKRASFAVGEGSARVHVMLARRGERLRLVAICAERVRPAVARALAQARFALAARGIAIEASLAGEA